MSIEKRYDVLNFPTFSFNFNGKEKLLFLTENFFCYSSSLSIEGILSKLLERALLFEEVIIIEDFCESILIFEKDSLSTFEREESLVFLMLSEVVRMETLEYVKKVSLLIERG